MSSYSKCRFCGNVDYATFPEPRMCGQCSISYLAGEEAAEERITKLLEDKAFWLAHLDRLDEMELLRNLVARIKGEK